MTEKPEANSPEMPIIEMTDVAISSQAYPDRAVIEGINWTVSRGEFWVIAGMHGSGKSDLMATTAGLFPPFSGNYRLFGHEMPIFEEQLLSERLRLGLVFEGGQLLQNLTIQENITLPLRYHRPEAAAQVITDMLELTGLEHHADSLPAVVSRSWHKRAGLARALVMRPEILLVDDPLSGLDPRHSHWWVEFLRGLAAGHDCMERRPLTLIVTTEDLRPWRNFDARFAILQDQRLTDIGRQTDLAGHKQALVKELLAEH